MTALLRPRAPSLVLVLSLLCAAGPSARACTLWGAVLDNAGGTLLSKNRDWKPDHTQVLKLHNEGMGFAYFGLYAVGNDSPGLKGGVNEKGLCVVSATAGSIPKTKREETPSSPSLSAKLLANYASCDAVLADKDKLLKGRRPSFLMVSDRKKILTIEIGLNGRYAVKVTEAGTVAHTNHFLEGSLGDCNLKVGESSTVRLARITELLKQAPTPLTAAAFATMSRDRSAGVNNSLWRTGKDSATLSSWILETPATGSPRLRVVIADPGKPERTEQLVLDEAFWKRRS